MPASDIGIDLGTRNSLAIFYQQEVWCLMEPSVVVYDKNTEKIRGNREKKHSRCGGAHYF